MAAITDYTSLAANISDWGERDESDTVDMLIGLAEAEFRLNLSPAYARETSSTLTFVSGSVAQPAGFIRPTGLTHATYGPLTETTMAAVRELRRVGGTAPGSFAITGSTIEVGPTYDGDLILDYETTLAGLSDSNATNWLILTAPQAYLSMCMSMAKARQEDYQSAATYRQAALDTLDKLGVQSMVAQFGQAAARIPGMTP